MTITPPHRFSVGRANTVLIIEDAAVLTTLEARMIPDPGNSKMRITGPGQFNEHVAGHIAEVVLPAVDQVLARLNLAESGVEISIANLGAASLLGRGLSIGGYSADVPLFLAVISVATGAALPDDLVTTGHIASPDGEIRMVEGLRAKLSAAIENPSIDNFIYPAFEQDGSIRTLMPENHEQLAGALAMAKRELRLVAVSDIGELVESVFTDEQVVQGALRTGFYSADQTTAPDGSPVERAVSFLNRDHDRRFWSVLEQYFQTGQSKEAASLLSLYARYHIDRGRYPRDFGGKLLSLLRALAPGIRRHQIVFPILPMSECLKLGGVASETDHEDIRRLMKAAFGEDLTGPSLVPMPEAIHVGQGTDPGDHILDLILSKISQDALTRLSQPIDQARDSYRLDSVLVASHETFFDILSSFYLHLLRHASSLREPADAGLLTGQVITLLERAFDRHGGKNAALAEARSGVKGGMRFVLNRLTDAFIQQEREEYITFVLTTAIDPLGREAKTSLMASLMKRLAPHLPPDIASEPPEHFIGAYEPLIRAYVASIDQIRSVFSTL